MSNGLLRRRRDLLLAGLGAGAGLVAGGTAVAVAQPSVSGAQATTGTLHGTVVAEPAPTGTHVTVKVDGAGVQTLPYLAPYVPGIGDVVAISAVSGGDNSSAVVLGGHSGRSGNLVVNGDFSRIPSLKSGGPPHMWGAQRLSGKAVTVAAMIHPSFQKPGMVLASYPDLAGEIVGYSAAFPVKAGDVIRADSSMAIEVAGAISVAVELRVAWFADTNALFPQAIAQSTLYGLTYTEDGKALFEGQAAAPAGAAGARLAVRAKHSGAAESQYDLFVGWVYAAR